MQLSFGIKYAEQSLVRCASVCLRVCLWVCVCVCVRSCAHAHASLDMQCLLFSARVPSASVSPAASFQRQFAAARNQAQQWEAQLCQTCICVICVSGAPLLGLGGSSWDGCSRPFSSFSANPLPPPLLLTEITWLAARCYSLLLVTPFPVHYIMYTWRAFYSFICYRLQAPHPRLFHLAVRWLHHCS